MTRQSRRRRFGPSLGFLALGCHRSSGHIHEALMGLFMMLGYRFSISACRHVSRWPNARMFVLCMI